MLVFILKINWMISSNIIFVNFILKIHCMINLLIFVNWYNSYVSFIVKMPWMFV